MSASLLAACLWVLAACLTALMPMRRQYVPGIALLFLAPVLLVWIGSEVGLPWAVVGLAGFVSMFRNPLRYIWARLRGRDPEVPR